MTGASAGTPQGNAIDPLNPPDIPEGMSRQLIEGLPFAIVIADAHLPDLPLIFVNKAFETMTGYRREEALGRNCRFLQGPRTSEADRAAIRHALAGGEELAIDILNYRANGEEFVNRMLLAPVEVDGEITHFVCITSEQTADLAKVERAAQLDEQLREVQHRVKNHLALLLALIRLEAKKATDPQASLSVLANRVEALNLLYDEFSRADNGTGTDIALGAYVSRVCSALNMLDGQGEVRMNLQTEEIRATMDSASQVGLLVSELLTNALQHAFDEGEEGLVEVALWVNGDDGTVCLQVIDNGRGIPKDIDWPNDGSLGARIVRELVRRVEGKLTVDTGESGTKVTIAIPASAITPDN